tara:strand:- start:59 stop:460 length:402 start_codon:yes stop_codon:yes gene_type:complete
MSDDYNFDDLDMADFYNPDFDPEFDDSGVEFDDPDVEFDKMVSKVAETAPSSDDALAALEVHEAAIIAADLKKKAAKQARKYRADVLRYKRGVDPVHPAARRQGSLPKSGSIQQMPGEATPSRNKFPRLVLKL